MAKTKNPKIFATLQLPKKKETWPGWNIVFKKWVTVEDIIEKKPEIELCINQYLEKNNDQNDQNLTRYLVSEMQATSNPHVCTFEVKAATAKGKKRIALHYPHPIIKHMHKFVLASFFGAPPPPAPPPPAGGADPGGSHTNTVTLHPPTT